MSTKLSRAEALRLAHEVAAWLVYELESGTFAREMPSTCMSWVFGMRWYVGHDLAGMCTVASYILVCVLQARGVNSGVLQERKFPHHIVETECGLLIDCTASQFGHDGPRVIRPRKVRPYATGATNQFLVKPGDHFLGSHPSWPSNWLPMIARILRRMGVDASFNVESEKVAA
jgi:hypothetical protein